METSRLITRALKNGGVTERTRPMNLREYRKEQVKLIGRAPRKDKVYQDNAARQAAYRLRKAGDKEALAKAAQVAEMVRKLDALERAAQTAAAYGDTTARLFLDTEGLVIDRAAAAFRMSAKERCLALVSEAFAKKGGTQERP